MAINSPGHSVPQLYGVMVSAQALNTDIQDQFSGKAIFKVKSPGRHIHQGIKTIW